jgi:hypothetical protein
MVIYSHDTFTCLKPANLLSWIGMPWARTQSKSARRQYELGARWFDVRIRFDKRGEAYFCHGGMKLKNPENQTVKSVLAEMATWKDVYLWVKLEERTDDGNDYQEDCFRKFAEWVNAELQPRCSVLCDLRVRDWTAITDDMNEHPELGPIPNYRGGGFLADFSSYNSLFPQVKIGNFWLQPTVVLGPWLFAKIFNKKIVEKACKNNVDVLHIDFIDEALVEHLKKAFGGEW